MNTIYKYKVESEVLMPQGAKILSIQDQGGELFLWACVDTSKKSEMRQFEVIGTGHPMNPHSKRHISTVQQGSFVWHIFETWE